MRIGLMIAGLVVLGGVVACSSAALDSAFAGAETNPSAGADGGAAPTGNFAGGGPADNAVILVHAAKSDAFRLCFSNELNSLPAPDSVVMPDANVVGVDEGSAVRLPPLAGAPGDIYLFDEPLIRAYYPQQGGTGSGPTCANLLSASNPLSSIAVKVGHIEDDLSTGVHLLVLTGCTGNGALVTYSTDECGSDWNATSGNRSITEITLVGATRTSNDSLPAQIVNLSKQLDVARGPSGDLSVLFGDVSTPNASLATVADAPPLFGSATPLQPSLLSFPVSDTTSYGTYGFQVLLTGAPDAGGAPFAETLDKIQAQSSPHDLPTTYYATASNYAFLLLGDPNPTLADGGPDTDDRRTLHLLAIPVIAPEVDAGGDASSDASSSDGGASSGDATTTTP